jgi:uncharacterized protein YmfQ (DUF2313 family)
MASSVDPGRDRHVRRSGEDYITPFLALFPQGIAWPRETESVFYQTCRGLARIWGYVDGRAADLLERESDPRKTIEILPEWERAWGLPDPCFPKAMTIGERQRMLVLVMTMLGGQSRAWFEWVANWIGFEIRFREWSPFMAGVSQVGETRSTKLDSGTSSSAVEITAGIDAATFVMNEAKAAIGYEPSAFAFMPGQRVRVAAVEVGDVYVEGIVSGYYQKAVPATLDDTGAEVTPRYAARTLIMSVDLIQGAGTFTNWILSIVSAHAPVVDDTQVYRWEIGHPDMRFFWAVEPGTAGVVWFRAASGQSGVDPHVRVMTAPDLACLFRRWKPAHTELVFDYSSLAAGGPMQGTP